MGDPQDSVNQAIREQFKQGKIEVSIPRDAFSRPKPTEDEDTGSVNHHDHNMGSTRNSPEKTNEHQGREEFRQMLQSLRSRKG